MRTSTTLPPPLPSKPQLNFKQWKSEALCRVMVQGGFLPLEPAARHLLPTEWGNMYHCTSLLPTHAAEHPPLASLPVFALLFGVRRRACAATAAMMMSCRHACVYKRMVLKDGCMALSQPCQHFHKLLCLHIHGLPLQQPPNSLNPHALQVELAAQGYLHAGRVRGPWRTQREQK